MGPFEPNPWLEPISVRIRHTQSGVSNEVRTPRRKMDGLELAIQCPNESFDPKEIEMRKKRIEEFLESAQKDLDGLKENHPDRKKLLKRVVELQKTGQLLRSQSDALKIVGSVRQLRRWINEHAERHYLDLLALLAQVEAEKEGHERPAGLGDPIGSFELQRFRRTFDSLERVAHHMPADARIGSFKKEQLLQKILLFKDPIKFGLERVSEAADEETHLVYDLFKFQREYDPKRAEALRDHFVNLLSAMGFCVRK